MAFGTYPYYPPIYPQYPQQAQSVPQVPQVQQTQQQMQIQNGGFVSIHGEQEARNYPVGVGTSVTF